MRLFQRAPSPPRAAAESALGEAIREELERAWAFWRSHAIELPGMGKPQPGRTLIPNLYHPRGRRAGADSEYQSFSMMFALWFNDRAVFDAVWNWTWRHLQTRPDDKLFWWAQYENGELGRGTAADGELGCIMALLLAAERWGADAYRKQALVIADSFREKCVTTIAGRRIIAAGANDRASRDFWRPDKGLVCFSNYLMTYPLSLMARAQPDADWGRVLTDSISLLTDSEKLYGHGFPPMTFRVKFDSGRLVPGSGENPPWNSFANTSSCRYLSFMLMDAIEGGQASHAYLARFHKLEDAYAQSGTLPWGWRDGQNWGPDCWPLLALLSAKRLYQGDEALASAVFAKASSLWRAANPADAPGEYLFNHACAMLALIPVSALMTFKPAVGAV